MWIWDWQVVWNASTGTVESNRPIVQWQLFDLGGRPIGFNVGDRAPSLDVLASGFCLLRVECEQGSAV